MSDILRRRNKSHNHGNYYKLNFILKVVHDIEHGKISITACRKKYGILGNSTVRRWLDKYGILDWSNKESFYEQ